MSGNKGQEVTLPELGQLSQRASVALALRCARRMLPLFQLPEDEPERAQLQAILELALTAAADFARGTRQASAEVAAVAQEAYAMARQTYAETHFAGFAAAHAVQAAAHALGNSPAQPAGTGNVVAAVFGACLVLRNNTPAFSTKLVQATLRADLDKLLDLKTAGPLGAPIDPSEQGPLGPLWPLGIPSWFSANG